MRLLLSVVSFSLAAGLAPTAALAADKHDLPPPAAPIFYCPSPMKAPPGPGCAAAARRLTSLHVRAHGGGHGVRIARAHRHVERRLHRDDQDVSASQAWVYRYERDRGGFSPWEVEHRHIARMPMDAGEHHDGHQWGRHDADDQRAEAFDRHDHRDGDHRDGDRRESRIERRDDGGDRYGAASTYSYERREQHSAGGYSGGEVNGVPYGHSWGDGDRSGGRHDDRGEHHAYVGESVHGGNGEHHAYVGESVHGGDGEHHAYVGESVHGGDGEHHAYTGEGAWRGDGEHRAYAGEGAWSGDGEQAEHRAWAWEDSSQRDDRDAGDDRGVYHWRYGERGGYEIYDYAGRDENGYLVWAGKPRR